MNLEIVKLKLQVQVDENPTFATVGYGWERKNNFI
jgi:hypothetical protein